MDEIEQFHTIDTQKQKEMTAIFEQHAPLTSVREVSRKRPHSEKTTRCEEEMEREGERDRDRENISKQSGDWQRRWRVPIFRAASRV